MDENGRFRPPNVAFRRSPWYTYTRHQQTNEIYGFPFGFMVSKMVDFPLCSPNGEEHWGQMQPVTIDDLKSQKEGPEPQV